METRAELRRESAPTANDGMVDVVIVSAYGRGNWMASELAGRGWKITLVDVSESLGPWEPEDCEGPFGLFESSDLLPAQKTQLIDEGETAAVPNGFTLWLKNGPLELKSEMTAFLLQKRAISSDIESYLRQPGLPGKESSRIRAKLLRATFEDSWMAHFAHQATSNVYVENHVALERRNPAPLFAPFSIRQVTQGGWQKGLKNCQASGARIRPRAVISDLRLEGSNVEALEIEEERSGVEKGRAFVWMLSSGETQRFSNNVFEKLYPAGALEAEWFWARYQVEMKGKFSSYQLPNHFVIMGDPCLPWTHENYMVVRKRVEPKRFDVWMRLPNWARFDQDYLVKMKETMEGVLAAKIPKALPQNIQMPAEAKHSFKKLGPPRFPIFDPDKRARFSTLKAPNLFFCGPEQWEFLDWLGQYRRQNEILVKLEKLKAQWVAIASREAQRNLAK